MLSNIVTEVIVVAIARVPLIHPFFLSLYLNNKETNGGTTWPQLLRQNSSHRQDSRHQHLGQVILYRDVIKRNESKPFNNAENDRNENNYGDEAAKVVDSRGRT